MIKTRTERVLVIHHNEERMFLEIPEEFPNGSRFLIGQKSTSGIRVVLPTEWRARLGYSPNSLSLSYENVLAKWRIYNGNAS